MISLNITNEDLKNDVSSVYGEITRYLEPGWYTLTITDIQQPFSKNGCMIGNFVFMEQKTGCQFNVSMTYQVQADKDGWRIQKTHDLIVRLCQAAGVSNWKQLIGKQVYAEVDVRESKRNTGEVDDMGVPITKEYKNNDFKKGALNKIILPVPKDGVIEAGNFNFDFEV